MPPTETIKHLSWLMSSLRFLNTEAHKKCNNCISNIRKSSCDGQASELSYTMKNTQKNFENCTVSDILRLNTLKPFKQCCCQKRVYMDCDRHFM